MTREDEIRELFPEAGLIEDSGLRDGVVAAWALAVRENDVEDLAELEWQPPEQARLGIPDETLVGHVRDVTVWAVDVMEAVIDRRGPVLDRDVVIAGALVHDVSKVYEYDFESGEHSDIGSLLVHPHYGVHVTAAVGLPVEVQHIVVSHSPRTAVEPATLEAELVRCVDELGASAIRLRGLTDLRDA